MRSKHAKVLNQTLSKHPQPVGKRTHSYFTRELTHWPLWCGKSCAASRFSVAVIMVGQRITAVLATLHTPSKNISFVRLLCRSVSLELDTNSDSHSAARPVITRCPSSLFFFQFWKFMGCFWVVFFRRVLSKHWRCLGLWLLSGCEVFVTVAKPTPSVMAWQSTNIHMNTHSRHGDFWLVVWMLTELFRQRRWLSPHAAEVSSTAAWWKADCPGLIVCLHTCWDEMTCLEEKCLLQVTVDLLELHYK